VHDRLNRFFEDEFFKDFYRPSETMSNWYPTTDIFETKDDFVFKLEVPGLSKDDIKIEFEKNTLSIKGERKTEKDVKDENYHRIERFSGTFNRSFTLPGETDGSKINASLKDGILELRIPKAEEKKAKSIPIKIN
jgi:HSP20 family protein